MPKVLLLEICQLEDQEVDVTEICNRERGCEGVNWIKVIQNRLYSR
jgi:hypothetical protein